MAKMAERSRGGEVPGPVTPLLPFDFPAKTPASGIPPHLRTFDTPRHPQSLICRHQRCGDFGEESLTGGKKRGAKAKSIARSAKETPPRQRKTAPIGAVVGFDVCSRMARIGKMSNAFQRESGWVCNYRSNT